MHALSPTVFLRGRAVFMPNMSISDSADYSDDSIGHSLAWQNTRELQAGPNKVFKSKLWKLEDISVLQVFDDEIIHLANCDPSSNREAEAHCKPKAQKPRKEVTKTSAKNPQAQEATTSDDEANQGEDEQLHAVNDENNENVYQSASSKEVQHQNSYLTSMTTSDMANSFNSLPGIKSLKSHLSNGQLTAFKEVNNIHPSLHSEAMVNGYLVSDLEASYQAASNKSYSQTSHALPPPPPLIPSAEDSRKESSGTSKASEHMASSSGEYCYINSESGGNQYNNGGSMLLNVSGSSDTSSSLYMSEATYEHDYNGNRAYGHPESWRNLMEYPCVHTSFSQPIYSSLSTMNPNPPPHYHQMYHRQHYEHSGLNEQLNVAHEAAGAFKNNPMSENLYYNTINVTSEAPGVAYNQNGADHHQDYNPSLHGDLAFTYHHQTARHAYHHHHHHFANHGQASGENFSLCVNSSLNEGLGEQQPYLHLNGRQQAFHHENVTIYN